MKPLRADLMFALKPTHAAFVDVPESASFAPRVAERASPFIPRPVVARRTTAACVKSTEELPQHMASVEARWHALQGAPGQRELQRRLDTITARIDPRKRADAHDAARRAQSTQGKVFWLRADAQHVLDAVAGESACKSGCSHCCNIGVTVSRAEAEVIAKATGRKLARPDAGRLLSPADMIDAGPEKALEALEKQRAWQVDEYHGVPCTFLSSKGTCSIYEDRPLACRWQVSMDEDALLCQLVPQGEPPVRAPYLNMSTMHGVYAGTFGGSPIADLRDWFPPGK